MEQWEEKQSKFAKETVQGLKIDGSVLAVLVARRIEASLRNLRRQYKRISTKEGATVSKATEWFLDNWYLAERQGKEAALHVRQMKKLRATGRESVLFILSNALVQKQKGQIDPDIMFAYFKETQKEIPFTEEEIGLLISALSAALVSYLESLVLQLEDSAATQLEENMQQAFSSLRLITGLDMLNLLDELSLTEQCLRADPAGVYTQMDERTRQRYRSTVSKFAKKKKIAEHEMARKLIELAKKGKGKEKHVGYYLFEKPMGNRERNRRTGIYIGGMLITSLFLTLLVGALLESVLVLLLLFVPISEIVKNIFDFFVIKFVSPRHIPRLALKEGVPETGKTLCVTVTLLDSEESGIQQVKRLEEYYLANRDAGKHLRFGMLADFPESKEAHLTESKQWIISTKAALEGLNEKYAHDFYLFYREREFNPKAKVYMGKERKRGAILELVRFLNGKSEKLNVACGDKEALFNTAYVITLDSDTRLNVGTAREMIAAMMHPLHKPVIDKKHGIVIEGTALMQPRIGVDLKAATKSRFTRIYAGLGGVDPYGALSSDVYQDLFGEGSFAGKGIFDVKAFYTCLDGTFPDNWVLSHDLLEGAYLKAAYLGDIEFTDGYPYKTLSFFSRSHRWIRGDFQLIPWLFPKVKKEDGSSVQNPLSFLNRYKMFDNLRRSFVPVFIMAALTLSMFISLHSLFWAGLIAVFTVLSTLFISSTDMLFRRDPRSKQRYHSTIVTGFSGGALQSVSRLILLPYEAYVHFSAICVAIWRMSVSRKNMLHWLVSVKSEQQSKTGLVHHYKVMFPAVLLGIMAVLFSGTVFKVAVGALWMLSPIYAMLLSRPYWKKEQLAEAEKGYLMECAADIWRYFSDFLSEEDNFLPPDNVQEVPAVGIAHRTSPTNIGLGIVSVLTAAKLELATKEEAVNLLQKMVDSIQKMEKWEGHLYNWYDTRTLRPLYPRYVSAVDNGNLSGYLLVAREMLYEMEERELGDSIDALYQGMSYTKLYDPKRNLFHIGYDLEKEELTEGYYDLLASEARQLSYIAIAKGDVPAKHWRRLGRALVEKNGYQGLASWSGSAFEYLMPNLIMPLYQDSLLYESLKFCVYVQQRGHRPWGVSESAFYSFDPSQSYSYKAHGAGTLALKRGMDKEKVIAPYATFLALLVAPKSAIKNLKRLEQLGAKGEYGFYEALDYTQSRRGDKPFAFVKTYMAHHLGMSFLSIYAVLAEQKMEEYFMQDRAMAAYSELLEEKVPIGQVVLEKTHLEIPQKPKRISGEHLESSKSEITPFAPKLAVLANGVYSVLVSETGHSRSMAGGKLITRFTNDFDAPVQGMGFYFQTEDVIYPLQAAAQCDKNVAYEMKCGASTVSLITKCADLQSEISLSLPQDARGEKRSVRLKNTGEHEQKGQVIFYAEPVLLEADDYFAHPAFAKLSLETSYAENTILVRRRPNGTRAEQFLAVSVSENFAFDTSREQAIGRSPLRAALKKQPTLTQGTVLDPCILIKVDVTLKAGEEKVVDFALCFGEKQEETKQKAQAILKAEQTEFTGYMEEKIGALGGKVQWEYAMNLAAKLIYPPEKSPEYFKENTQGARDLWQYGISGDLPLVTIKLEEEQKLFVKQQIMRHSFLQKCGLQYDLVFLLSDSGDYRRPHFTALDDCLREMGLSYLKGEKGGIHAVEHQGDMSAVYAKSVEIYENNEQILSEQIDESLPYVSHEKAEIVGETPVFSYTESGQVQISMQGNLPPNTWSHMLTNGNFSYIATESGTGHMWQINARENQIAPWENDTLTTKGVEQLCLWQNGREVSLFADADGNNASVTYGFGYAVWEKEILGRKVKTTAFIPKDMDARVFIIEGDFPEDAEIAYYAKLKLGESEKSSAYVVTGEENGMLWAKNPANIEFPDTKVTLAANVLAQNYTTNRMSYMKRKLDKKTGTGHDPCLYVRYPAENQLVLVIGTAETGQIKRLTNKEFAQKKLEGTKTWWQEKVGNIQVETGIENLDRLLSGWAMYQSLACRIFGRSSVYQSGGAYGFRDQLQDSTAVLAVDPSITKNMLIEAAKHQFEEGDVMHWWHPNGVENSAAKGVRTRCSDDLLFLPYVLCQYVEKTGDSSICDISVPYIRSKPLETDEHERYSTAEKSDLEESLFLHAKRAIDLVHKRGAGAHGLCFIGTGDWNDGMNLVGAKGKGESVWLSWFYSHVLERFADLCERQNQAELATKYRMYAKEYGKAADSAWDGKWYLRGYYDNGATLGSHADEECQIDAIAQGFAALSPHASAQKVKQAITEATERLLDKENKLVKLFQPPFEKGLHNPGYIRGYAPGLRENGGQYTHGVLWLAMGAFRAGLTDLGFLMLQNMLPADRAQSVYRGEPYVLAADVYANEQHKGRAGWTWYTGASAWYFRVATEEMLGLHLENGKLYIRPNLPKQLPRYRVRWNAFDIVVENGDITVNGEKYAGQGLPIFKTEQETLPQIGKV